MRAGHGPQGPVVAREIVEHPHGIRDPVSLLVRYGADVGVQRLHPAGVRVGGADVQAAQFEPLSQHVPDALQDFRRCNHALEDFALVDQVGKPRRVWLLLELRACLLSLFGEKLRNTPPQTFQKVTTHETFENNEALLIETLFFKFRHYLRVSVVLICPGLYALGFPVSRPLVEGEIQPCRGEGSTPTFFAASLIPCKVSRFKGMPSSR